MRRYLYFGLILSPLVLLVYFTIKYASNFPFWDQWELVPLLSNFYERTLTFADLWKQHNEHRILFPRIIMIALAVITHWNIYYEIALNVILGISIFLLILYQVKKLGYSSNLDYLKYFAISLFIFSVLQAENWLWGWQIQIFLNVLAFLTGIFLLSSKVNYFRLFVAIFSGIIATYSFANGMFYWVVGFFLLWFGMENIPKRKKYLMFMLWLITAGLMIASYLYKYQKPLHHPTLWFALQHPTQSLAFFFAYLGAPVAVYNFKAAAVVGFLGTVGCASILYSSYNLYRRQAPEFRLVLPWLAMMGFSICTAVVTMIGRVGISIEQALASHYITYSNLFWISLFALIPWAKRVDSRFPLKFIYNKKICVVILGVLFFMELQSIHKMWEWGAYHYSSLETARTQINSQIYDDKFIRTNIYPTDLREAIDKLNNRSLASFRKNNYMLVNEPYSQFMVSDDISYSIDSLDDLGEFVRIKGWAIINGMDSEKNLAFIVLQSERQKYIIPATVKMRHDVTLHFKKYNYDNSGYEVEFSKQKLETGTYKVGIYIKNKEFEAFKFSDRTIQVSKSPSKD